jgi:hypothetical protein
VTVELPLGDIRSITPVKTRIYAKRARVVIRKRARNIRGVRISVNRLSRQPESLVYEYYPCEIFTNICRGWNQST